MAVFTERVTIGLPAGAKAQLREYAKQEGISPSAVMRDIVSDLIAEHDLRVTIARIEQRDATLQ